MRHKVRWALPEYEVPSQEEFSAQMKAQQEEEAQRIATANTPMLLRSRLLSTYFREWSNSGISIISVRGVLYNWNYLDIARCIEYAQESDEINKILLVMNSPGGQTEGLMELASIISKVEKPVYGYVEGYCTSATYALASATDRIFASPTSEIGSLGIRAEYYDYSGMRKNEGIKIYSFRSKHASKKALPPDTEEGKQEIQKDLNETEVLYFGPIASNRGMTVEELIEKAADGLVFRAQEAKDRGLIDEIVTDIDACVEIIKSEKDEGEGMADNTIATLEALTAAYPALVAKATENGRLAGVEEGKKAESDRVKSILALSEYTDNMAVLTKAVEEGKTASEAQMEILKAQKAAKANEQHQNDEALKNMANASTENNANVVNAPVDEPDDKKKALAETDRLLNVIGLGEGEKK